jgi:DNA (cytosine-5)-methyltransferase 1
MPKILDLYCCQGGAGMGYYAAGFDVVGVDIDPQPRYPFEFVQADALAFLRHVDLSEFAAVHASPPCQARSDLRHRTDKTYPELIVPTQELLDLTGLPFVIENVEGAYELRDPVMICGASVPGVRCPRHPAPLLRDELAARGRRLSAR